MRRVRITDEDRKAFQKTQNGAKKRIWMHVGMIIDFCATLCVSLLKVFSHYLPNYLWYYIILFILLVIVVLGGELIGVYYGALEQYVFNKSNRKEVKIDE